VTDLDAAGIAALREDLSAAFRITAQMGWHESVGNHFSAAVSADGKRFLLNRKWQHFASIRPADLMLLDADDPEVMTRPDAPDASAWTIHGTVHRQCCAARVIIHCHPPHATALATLADPRMVPLDNNTARYFGRLALDEGFGGIADEAAEGLRIAAALANNRTLLMRNHGLTCVGDSVAEAFEDLYFFEKAAQTLLLAYASGQPLNVLSDEIAEKTARGWDDYKGMAFAHFAHLKSRLPALD
jgi:ribulose-5-phosphate 4-epimerase/fuculose-1-phosphate aldolase